MSTVILVNECLMVAIVKQKEKQSMNIYGIALWNSLSIRCKLILVAEQTVYFLWPIHVGVALALGSTVMALWDSKANQS